LTSIARKFYRQLFGKVANEHKLFQTAFCPDNLKKYPHHPYLLNKWWEEQGIIEYSRNKDKRVN